MANPLDRDINKVLRKGRAPEAWKRPGTKVQILDQSGSAGEAGPVGQAGKPPGTQGMNKPAMSNK
jgi:hypothetical protein